MLHRFALTKLDILDELKEVKLGVKYLRNGKEVKEFPGFHPSQP